MRWLLACLPLLAACSASNEPGGAATTGASGGPASSGGEGGSASVASAGGGGQSSTSTAGVGGSGGAGSASTGSTGAGGAGGAGDGGTGGSGTGGGSGGGPTCPDPACDDDARVMCNPACPGPPVDCVADACAGGSSQFVIDVGTTIVQLPAVEEQAEACSACSGTVLLSLVAALPELEEGCVLVEAPPGVTWDVAVAPATCPGGDDLGCERVSFGPDTAYVHIVVHEPASFARDVRIEATEGQCAGAPICSTGCNGAGG